MDLKYCMVLLLSWSGRNYNLIKTSNSWMHIVISRVIMKRTFSV